MYLHIGRDMVVPTQSILGVFDLDTASCGKHTRAFLKNAEENGAVVDVAGELPRAFVLTEEAGLERTFLTQLSSATLEKRCEKGFSISES